MSSGLFDLADRVIVITGGLGQLGRQFTRILVEYGARVAVLDVAVGSADKQLETLERAGRIMTIHADVSQRASLENAARQIEAIWTTPFGLINNAALDSPPDAPAAEVGPFEEYPETSFDQVMNVNVKGVFLSCQVFGVRMASVGRGSIVNISSIYGLVSPNQQIYEFRRTDGATYYKPVAYSVSKSALFNMTRYLSTYWAGVGVRVNTLTLAGVFRNQDPRFLEAYQQRIPIGRMAREDEYNGAIVFLCSDASSYMTGSNLVVDGGWTAW